jgi:hypothetical protein
MYYKGFSSQRDHWKVSQRNLRGFFNYRRFKATQLYAGKIITFLACTEAVEISNQLVIYPNECHDFQKLENTVDVNLRTIEWFNSYLAAN